MRRLNYISGYGKFRSWYRDLAVVLAVLLLAMTMSCSKPSTVPGGTALPPRVLAVLERVRAGEAAGLDSLLIERDGKLIAEIYRNGTSADDLRPLYSVTKTVTSLLAGIAQGEGSLPPVDTALASIFPTLPLWKETPAKKAITLEHVLTMSAGLAWDEDSTNYNDTGNPVHALMAAPDPSMYVLSQPLVAEPGKTFVYNSGLSVLLGHMLEAVTHTSLVTYAAQKLFEPLEISSWKWDSIGEHANTGWGLSLAPKDLLKLGHLVLDKGRWEGRAIVPETYISVMTQVRAHPDNRLGYGYQIWLRPLRAKSVAEPGARIIPVFLGWGGQYVYVLEKERIVIVSTASDFDSASPGISPMINELLEALTE